MRKIAVILRLALPFLPVHRSRTPPGSPALPRVGASVAALHTRVSLDARECLGPSAETMYIDVDPLHPDSVSVHLHEPMGWPDPPGLAGRAAHNIIIWYLLHRDAANAAEQARIDAAAAQLRSH